MPEEAANKLEREQSKLYKKIRDSKMATANIEKKFQKNLRGEMTPLSKACKRLGFFSPANDRKKLKTVLDDSPVSLTP